jgi:hypothetical protein
MRSILRECKVLGVIAAIMGVVWTVGYSVQMDEQAGWLVRLPAGEGEQDYYAALEAAESDEILTLD